MSKEHTSSLRVISFPHLLPEVAEVSENINKCDGMRMEATRFPLTSIDNIMSGTEFCA